MLKLQFLAPFPVDNLAHPVVFRFVHFLSEFAAFTYYVTDRFVSINSYPTSIVCCVWSILVLIWLVIMALFCAAIRRDSVSLLRFLFLIHAHVFSGEMLLIIIIIIINIPHKKIFTTGFAGSFSLKFDCLKDSTGLLRRSWEDSTVAVVHSIKIRLTKNIDKYLGLAREMKHCEHCEIWLILRFFSHS